MTFSKQGELVQFLSAGDAKINSCKVYFSPKQAGTGDPSPENVREISGYDGVSITHAEYCKRCIPITPSVQTINGLTLDYSSGNGKYHLYGTTTAATNIDVDIEEFTVTNAEGRRLFLNNTTTASGSIYFFRNSTSIDAWNINSVNRNSSYNALAGKVVNKIRFSIQSGKTVDLTLQPEFRIPVTEQTRTLDWTDEVGTVYGGYVDLISGEVVEEWERLEIHAMSDAAYYNSGTNSGTGITWCTVRKRIYKTPVVASTPNAGDSNGILNVGDWQFSAITGRCRAYARNAGYISIVCPESIITGTYDLTTSEGRTQFFDACEEQFGGFEIAYKHEPTILATLTPQAIQTLTGQNNFWSSADRIEIEYDLIETRQIEMARRNIIMNSPHIESVTGSNASFITDVVSNLKECKIHFTPVQEGSGDPSPDNVRSISGWDSVTVYKTGKNLLVKEEITFTTNKYIKTDGTIGDSSYYKLSNVILCKHLAGKTITTNALVNAGGASVKSLAFYLSDEVSSDTCVLAVHKATASVEHITFNVPSTAKYMLMCLNKATTLDNKYIVEGTEPLNEVDTPTAVTIPFPQTIYGGYVDLVKGEVVETWAKWVEDGSRTPTYWIWTKDDANAVYTALMPALPVGSRHNAEFGFIEKVMCPSRRYVGINSSGVRTSNIISLYRAYNSASFAYSFTGEEFASMSKAELKAYIAENPIEAVYILLTPRIYPLDPVTIRTLRGMNNIFSDANGNITVSYFTH